MRSKKDNFRPTLIRISFVSIVVGFVLFSIDLANGKNTVLSGNYIQIVLLMNLTIIAAMISDVIFSFIGKLIGYEATRPKKMKRKFAQTGIVVQDSKESEKEMKINYYRSVKDLVDTVMIKRTERQDVKQDFEVIYRNPYKFLGLSYIIISILGLNVLTIATIRSSTTSSHLYFVVVYFVLLTWIRYLISRSIHWSIEKAHAPKIRASSNLSRYISSFDLKIQFAEYIFIAIFLILTGFYIESILLLIIILYLQYIIRENLENVHEEALGFYDEDNDVMLYLYQENVEIFQVFAEDGLDTLIFTNGLVSLLNYNLDFMDYYELELETSSWYTPTYVKFIHYYGIPAIIGLLLGFLFTPIVDHYPGTIFSLMSIGSIVFWFAFLGYGYYYTNTQTAIFEEVFSQSLETKLKHLEEMNPQTWTVLQSELFVRWKSMHFREFLIYSEVYSSIWGYMNLYPNMFSIFEKLEEEVLITKYSS